jgi:hypothetical protein
MAAAESRVCVNASRECGMPAHRCAASRAARHAAATTSGHRQQQIERGAGTRWRDVEAAADDRRAMLHAGNAATGAFAGEADAGTVGIILYRHGGLARAETDPTGPVIGVLLPRWLVGRNSAFDPLRKCGRAPSSKLQHTSMVFTTLPCCACATSSDFY